ncbi:hypothetical protein AB0A98_38275 [Streptomyces chrestomyceticus]|uniref:hypothetical protein n=1 Tax=Streptomyces chrestomyceticus TaxID=68185 RepID=UPI003410BBA1
MSQRPRTSPSSKLAATAPRQPRYVIRPAERADYAAVCQRLPHLTHWMQDGTPVGSGSADEHVITFKLGEVDDGHPLTWLLLDGPTIRACALLRKERACNADFQPQPGMALWIDDLYADDLYAGPDRPGGVPFGPLMVDWFADYAARYDQARWVCEWTSVARLADAVGPRHGMEVRRSTPCSASLLRRPARLHPRLAQTVEAQLPPCVRG